jgi:uncharacterized membrane protein
MTTPTRSRAVPKDPVAKIAAAQYWITPAMQRAAQDAIKGAIDKLGGEPVARALHGDWMHKPLHAVLTDVPVGAWTATVACDAIASLTGSAAMDSAADATVVIGLIGATGAAITGMNDWSGVEKPAARRIGAVHALLNITATGLFIGSLCARRNKARSTGRALSVLGYLLVGISGHLGGNLVYEHGVGVGEQ